MVPGAGYTSDTGTLRDKSGDIERLYPRVRRMLIRVLGPREDLEDLVQVCMETLVKKRAGLKEEGAIGAFAEGIALNVARNRLRQDGLRRFLMSVVAKEDLLPQEGSGPPEVFEGRERLRRVYAAMNGLSEKRRTTFILYSVMGKSATEVAELLGTRPDTVRTRVFEARRQLVRKAREDPYLSEWLEGRGK